MVVVVAGFIIVLDGIIVVVVDIAVPGDIVVAVADADADADAVVILFNRLVSSPEECTESILSKYYIVCMQVNGGCIQYRANNNISVCTIKLTIFLLF
jgi:hypothetical protein